MAKYTTGNITTQTTTYICDVQNPRAGDATKLLVAVVGTFNGSTATISVSVDEGVTYVPLKNSAGTTIAFTANGAIAIEVPCAHDAAPVKLAVVTSAASPTGIVATAFDLR